MFSHKTLLSGLGGCLLLAGPSLLGELRAADSFPRPLTTKQPFFSIPFYLNPNVPAPGEVVLHVSGDQGKKWSLYQKRRPDQGRFDFQAGADGEYWFVVRTTRDEPPAADATKPEKIVIVDRQPPELKVDVSRDDLGQIRVHWTAQDASIDSSTFLLDYRMSETEEWQPVTVDLPESRPDAEAPLEGQVTWTLRETTNPVEVRAQISDRAGNRREWLAPVGTTNSTTATPPSASAVSSNSPPDSAQVGTAPATNPAGDWTSQGDSTPPPVSDLQWRSGAPAVSPTLPGIGGTSSLGPPTTPASSKTEPPDSAATPELGARSQREIRWTKATRIELDYDVANTPELGLGRVELWMTIDEGFTWNAQGLDADLQSPFVVDLPQDGIYGFKLLIHDKQGRSAPAPTAGDDADLWVGLDRISPQVRITDAKAVAQGEESSVQLAWSAVDNNLGRAPVRILYGPAAEGPWATLVENLPNHGHYEGQAATRLPARTYLKIEVRDEAGNLGEAQTTEPIGQPGRPRGIIRGFKPLSFLPKRLWK